MYLLLQVVKLLQMKKVFPDI